MSQEHSEPMLKTLEDLDEISIAEALEKIPRQRFAPYESGMFPAIPPEIAKETGMDMAWFRDNAHVANALYEAGDPEQKQQGIRAGEAMLQVLKNNQNILDGIADGSLDPTDDANRLPIRVKGDTLENDHESRVQNDSIGYVLWFTSKLIKNGDIEADADSLDTLAQTITYLDKVQYWQDADAGHWEEDRRVQAASIGVVVAGLREAKAMFETTGYNADSLHIDELDRKGMHNLERILDSGVTDVLSIDDLDKPYPERRSDIPDSIQVADVAVKSLNALKEFDLNRRRADAALLFLIEPLGVLDGERARKMVADVEEYLVREHGIARYPGDTYWGPEFKDIIESELRTSSEGDINKRNLTAQGIAGSGTEAQWTMFDPTLSAIYGKFYQQSGGTDKEARRKQLYYLKRSINEFDQDGNRPEALYYTSFDEDRGHDGESKWLPNDHNPLLWSQANWLRAVRTFTETTNI